MKRVLNPVLAVVLAALVIVNIAIFESRIRALERQVGQLTDSVITLAKASESNSNAISSNSRSIGILAGIKEPK